jgi:hypothetical protein
VKVSAWQKLLERFPDDYRVYCDDNGCEVVTDDDSFTVVMRFDGDPRTDELMIFWEREDESGG